MKPFNPRLRLRHIVCFLEVVRLGSIVKAASSLNISQPAVTKTIQDLEELLGVVLFDRSHRWFTLTEPGEVFLRYASDSVTTLRRGIDVIRNVDAQAATLRVGVLPTASSRILPQAVLDYADRDFAAKLHIFTGPNDYLLSQLRLGDADFVVGRMADPEKMNGLTFEQLYSEKVVFAVRSGHPLLAQGSQFGSIADYRLIMPPADSIIRRAVERLFLMHGITDYDDRLQTVSGDFGRALTVRSDYIWVISEGVISDDMESGQLAVLPFETGVTAGPVGLTRRYDSVVSLAAEVMMNALRHAAAACVR